MQCNLIFFCYEWCDSLIYIIICMRIVFKWFLWYVIASNQLSFQDERAIHNNNLMIWIVRAVYSFPCIRLLLHNSSGRVEKMNPIVNLYHEIITKMSFVLWSSYFLYFFIVMCFFQFPISLSFRNYTRKIPWLWL